MGRKVHPYGFRLKVVRDWQGLGFDQAVLEKVFHRNAERFFATLKG